MIDVNWDLAPEGAEELVQFESHVTWRKGIKIWCMVQQGWRDYVSDFKAIATRPTQTKTVADAVEKCKGLWPNKFCKGLYYDPKSDEWFCNDSPLPWYQFICTRSEFEAYVKEQEGEKWTHTIDGLKVRFLVDGPDEAGEVPVVADDGYYRIFDVDQLKPIKPTISEAEAWRKVQDGHPAGFIMEKYNVVEKD